MKDFERKQLQAFFDTADEAGVTNREKIGQKQQIIRRLATTDKAKSYEAAGAAAVKGEFPAGVVQVDDRLIGFGIHILNEDIYPLQSFEIYLRGCDLTGSLDLSHCADLLFVDVYHNRISQVHVADMPSLRILGLQDNRIEALDPTGLPACQGIDVGKNCLKTLDVSQNRELVELYVNDNQLTQIDLSRNPKLKHVYCHNNGLIQLDTRANPLLRHLNATGNPLKQIHTWAPQRETALPLSLTAEEGGCVGLRYNPVYNAQWKETGQWQQAYYAYPDPGYAFAGWYDENGICRNSEAVWEDRYGESRCLTARFQKE